MAEGATPQKPKIITVVGPTASGKTTLGIFLAKHFDGEIVSADSRQIYRGMDIGTAKPTELETSAIPHYMINIKDPDEDYTVSEYKTDAIAAIHEISKRGHLPLLVGGTGLYIKAVLENLDIPNIEADAQLRAELEKEIEEKGLDSVVQKLLAVDPDAVETVDLKNPRRVVRALEVTIATGQPFTAQQKKNEPLFDPLTIGIDVPSEVLRQRIDGRIDTMMQEGFVDEVKALIKKYPSTTPAFNAIGYAEIINYLQSGTSLDEAVAAIKLNTWHYAKRQMTWFKKDKSIRWVREEQGALFIAKNFLE